MGRKEQKIAKKWLCTLTNNHREELDAKRNQLDPIDQESLSDAVLNAVSESVPLDRKDLTNLVASLFLNFRDLIDKYADPAAAKRIGKFNESPDRESLYERIYRVVDIFTDENFSVGSRWDTLSSAAESLLVFADKGVVALYVSDPKEPEQQLRFHDRIIDTVTNASKFLLITGRLHDEMLNRDVVSEKAWLEPTLRQKKNLCIDFLVASYWQGDSILRDHPWLSEFSTQLTGEVIKQVRDQSLHIFTLAKNLQEAEKTLDVQVGIIEGNPIPMEILASESRMFVEFLLSSKRTGTSLVFEFERTADPSSPYWTILSEWKHLMNQSGIDNERLKEINSNMAFSPGEVSFIDAVKTKSLKTGGPESNSAFERAGVKFPKPQKTKPGPI